MMAPKIALQIAVQACCMLHVVCWSEDHSEERVTVVDEHVECERRGIADHLPLLDVV